MLRVAGHTVSVQCVSLCAIKFVSIDRSTLLVQSSTQTIECFIGLSVERHNPLPPSHMDRFKVEYC